MHLLHRDSLWFGLSFVVLGVVVAGLGYLRFKAQLAETTGVITQCRLFPGAAVSGGIGPRVLDYRYSVSGREYSGEGWLRYSARQDDVLQTGHVIPVFFDRAHPRVSYPIYPPSNLPWIGESLVLVGFGVVAIVWGWR